MHAHGSRCKHRTESVWVLAMAAHGSKHRQGYLLLGGGYPITSLQEKTNNVGPIHHSKRNCPRCRSDPWLQPWPLKGESSAQNWLHLLCYSPPPWEGASQTHTCTTLSLWPPQVHAARTQSRAINMYVNNGHTNADWHRRMCWRQRGGLGLGKAPPITCTLGQVL